MPRLAFLIGLFLILLGLFAYFVTGRESVTALIPAFFGIPFGLLGWLGREGRRVKLTMHLATLLALVGVAGSASGLPGAWTLLTGGEVERPAAVWVQSIMAIVCAVFLLLAVRSFILARRCRSVNGEAQA